MARAWRIRMKSQAGHVHHASARDFAVKEGWLGTGWGLNASDFSSSLADGSTDFNEYLRLAELWFEGDKSLKPAVTRIALEMAKGDYCWMYDTFKGEFWCAKVIGDFQYKQGGKFDEHDLHVLRRCEWANAGPADAVPGVIQRAFAGPFGNITQLKTGATKAIQYAKHALGEETESATSNLFVAAGPEDLEDLVALYLQDKGWSIYPSTAKRSMASYEFVAVERCSGRKAGVQVKSGSVDSLTQGIAAGFDKFFVLLGGENPQVRSDGSFSIISKQELEAFAKKHHALLPSRLREFWNPLTA